MGTSGHLWKVLSGALIFVHPSQYRLTMRALSHTSLQPDQIIVSESLEYLVEEVMSQCRRVWTKGRDEISGAISEIATAGENVEDLFEVPAHIDAKQEYEIVVHRT